MKLLLAIVMSTTLTGALYAAECSVKTPGKCLTKEECLKLSSGQLIFTFDEKRSVRCQHQDTAGETNCLQNYSGTTGKGGIVGQGAGEQQNSGAKQGTSR